MLNLSDETPGPSRPKSSTAKMTKSKAKPAPPQFDRSGEMPDGADTRSDPKADTPSSSRSPAPTPSSLAGVDLLTDAPITRPTSRFDEYKVDDEDSRQTVVEAADEPVKGEIEVVKVKRKKKKEGTKKKA